MNFRLPLIGLAALTLAANTPAATLSTHAERSDFKQTGRYQEAIDLCAAFAREYPDAVRCEEFGRSPEGRPLTIRARRVAASSLQQLASQTVKGS